MEGMMLFYFYFVMQEEHFCLFMQLSFTFTKNNAHDVISNFRPDIFVRWLFSLKCF